MVTESVFFIFGLVLKIFTVWFFLTALMFWKKPTPYPRRQPQTRFCCLIAARNEERVIGELVQSLQAQDYPRELYEICVIPNNCTDDTEGAARRAGARILNCDLPVRYKGDALRQALARLAGESFDAFCVFDADNLVSPDYLSRMNDAFLAGARVTKARLTTRNPYASWVSGCYTLYFAIFDCFFNRSRSHLGLSAKLVGTGFCVHRDVLQKLGGWRTESIAEDAEFAAELSLSGERVWWVPEAVTYDEAPQRFGLSLTQRRRWISGIMTVAGLKSGKLLKSLFSGPAYGPTAASGLALSPVERRVRIRQTLRRVDSLMFLGSPFAQALSVVPVIGFLTCQVIKGGAAFLAGGGLLSLLLPIGAGLLAGYVGLAGGGLVLAWASGHSCRHMVSGILGFPLFMASWLPLAVLSLFHKTTEWKVIAHGVSAKRAGSIYE